MGSGLKLRVQVSHLLDLIEVDFSFLLNGKLDQFVVRGSVTGVFPIDNMGHSCPQFGVDASEEAVNQ